MTTEPTMYPCLKCGGYGPTNHDPDCPNKPTTEERHMIRAADLPDWILVDESQHVNHAGLPHGSGWTVRERYRGLNSGQPPILLIASGTGENMRLVAAAVAMARFLSEIVRSENPNPVRINMKARALLTIAGIEP